MPRNIIIDLPWPADEHIRPPTGYRTPAEWWRNLHSAQRKQWAPLFRAMTPAQRKQFHEERWRVCAELPSSGRFAKSERLDAYGKMFRRWSAILDKEVR